MSFIIYTLILVTILLAVAGGTLKNLWLIAVGLILVAAIWLLKMSAIR